jgi:vacuolar-type H+-ATPase subunit H
MKYEQMPREELIAELHAYSNKLDAKIEEAVSDKNKELSAQLKRVDTLVDKLISVLDSRDVDEIKSTLKEASDIITPIRKNAKWVFHFRNFFCDGEVMRPGIPDDLMYHYRWLRRELEKYNSTTKKESK